jgi:hypothetical protein
MKMRRTQGFPQERPVPVMSGVFPEKTPLAMAYVPYQVFDKVYEADEAICRGTLFPELDLPFECEEEKK